MIDMYMTQDELDDTQLAYDEWYKAERNKSEKMRWHMQIELIKDGIVIYKLAPARPKRNIWYIK